jgi:hypothetical protein
VKLPTAAPSRERAEISGKSRSIPLLLAITMNFICFHHRKIAVIIMSVQYKQQRRARRKGWNNKVDVLRVKRVSLVIIELPCLAVCAKKK